MTIDTFLRRLRQTPQTWRLAGNQIRCRRTRGCPMTRAGGVRGRATLSRAYQAALKLRLSHALAESIILASDNSEPEYCDLDLRRRLLLACGVKETP